jgi:hypothetical protein
MPGNKGRKRRHGTFTPPIFGNTLADVLANLPVEIDQVRIDGLIYALPS